MFHARIIKPHNGQWTKNSLKLFLWQKSFTYLDPFQYHHPENRACSRPAALAFFLSAKQEGEKKKKH